MLAPFLPVLLLKFPKLISEDQLRLVQERRVILGQCLLRLKWLRLGLCLCGPWEYSDLATAFGFSNDGIFFNRDRQGGRMSMAASTALGIAVVGSG